MKRLMLVIVCLGLAGCQRGPDQVFDKVLTDFGIRDQPEGHVSGADKVFQGLDTVGKTELKRLNQQSRHGEVKFQQDGLRGMYYNEVKVYENYYPLDAQPVTRASEGTRGFNGYIEYSYRIYETARKSTRAEAMAEAANLPTEREGRERYRYGFTSAGTWNGGKGEKVRR